MNNNEIRDSNGFFAVRGLSSISVTCRLDGVDPLAKIVLERIVNGQTFTLNSYTTSYTGSYTLWTYTLTDADKLAPVSTYRCRDSVNANCPDYVQVTLYSTTQRPPPGATIPGCPPGGSSNPPPSSNPTTRPSSGELGSVVVVRFVPIMLEILSIIVFFYSEAITYYSHYICLVFFNYSNTFTMETFYLDCIVKLLYNLMLVKGGKKITQMQTKNHCQMAG